MKQFFITGSSSGIGKAMAELLLEDENNKVWGISRSCTIEHPRYEHRYLDLSNSLDVQHFEFPIDPEAQSHVLINNAGTLGQIKHLGNIEPLKIVEAFQINLTSLALLSNQFCKQVQDLPGERIILNISSGAGKYPIDGWSTYCASKAGVDLFSRVLGEEQKLKPNPIGVFAVSPGVVDTPMQGEIRRADKENFSNLERFIDYQAQGELLSPKESAAKILGILDSPGDFSEIILSIRDLK